MSDQQTIRDELHSLLGANAAAAVVQRVNALAETYAGRDAQWLRAARAVLDEPLAPLREGAGRMSILQADQASAAQEFQNATGEAEAANRLFADPQQRAGAGEKMGKAEQKLREAYLEHQGLSLEVEQLRDEGKDPTTWLERHGKRAEHALALDDALARVDADRAGDWMSQSERVPDPLLPYRDRLGPDFANQIAGEAYARKEQIEAMGPDARMALRGDSPKPFVGFEHADVGKSARLRISSEKLERRKVELDARIEVLEATGFRPEVAKTLRREQPENAAALDSVQAEQWSIWRAHRTEAEKWMQKHHEEAAFSVAVEHYIAAEVEQGLRDRESAVAHEPPSKLVRDYVPSAAELQPAASAAELQTADASDVGGYGY